MPWYVDGSSIDKAEEQAANERMRLLPSLSEDKVRDIVDSLYWGFHPLVVPVARIQAATHSAETAKSRSGIGLAVGTGAGVSLLAMISSDIRNRQRQRPYKERTCVHMADCVDKRTICGIEDGRWRERDMDAVRQW